MQALQIVETLAEQLHREHRAAEKALNRVKLIWRKGKQVRNDNRLLHDHGWKSCGRRDYFRKRANFLLSKIKEPVHTLGQAEERFHAEVLRRRLAMRIQP